MSTLFYWIPVLLIYFFDVIFACFLSLHVKKIQKQKSISYVVEYFKQTMIMLTDNLRCDVLS